MQFIHVFVSFNSVKCRKTTFGCSSFNCHPSMLQVGQDFSTLHRGNKTAGCSAEMFLAELQNTNKPTAQNNHTTESGQSPLSTNGRNTAKDLSFINQNQYLEKIPEGEFVKGKYIHQSIRSLSSACGSAITYKKWWDHVTWYLFPWSIFWMGFFMWYTKFNCPWS